MVGAEADLGVYDLLREVALDQASYQFWEGADLLAQELGQDVIDPASCFFVCLSCVGTILAYIASVGGLVIGCATVTPACIIGIIAHEGANALLIAACGACAVCIDEGEGVFRAGTGDITPYYQQ